VDDSVAAYHWLIEGGVQPEGLVIAGDSAGANLALATMLVLREAGEPLPAAAVCLSPWVDLLCQGESMVTNAHPRHLAQKASLLVDTGYYLNGADSRNPLASPIHADLTGLPPMLIQVGGVETLVDDATHLAERARDAGVDATLEVWEGMIHEWHLLAALLPEDDPLQEAVDAIERIGAFVRQHTSRPKRAVRPDDR
jgi:phosphinothricin tripeptide acetyl hydrolase